MHKNVHVRKTMFVDRVYSIKCEKRLTQLSIEWEISKSVLNELFK